MWWWCQHKTDWLKNWFKQHITTLPTFISAQHDMSSFPRKGPLSRLAPPAPPPARGSSLRHATWFSPYRKIIDLSWWCLPTQAQNQNQQQVSSWGWTLFFFPPCSGGSLPVKGGFEGAKQKLQAVQHPVPPPNWGRRRSVMTMLVLASTGTRQSVNEPRTRQLPGSVCVTWCRSTVARALGGWHGGKYFFFCEEVGVVSVG